MMKDNKTQLLTAFFVGSTIGAVTALLFAPHSGRRMRRIIGNEARNCIDQISEKGRDIYDRCQDLAGDAARFVKRGTSGVAR